MKSKTLRFQNITVLLLLVVYLSNFSCKQQAPKASQHAAAKEIQNTSQPPNSNKIPSYQNSQVSAYQLNFTDQISQVVRTVFQDSQQNIWFGTQDGAFKYDGITLIHQKNILDKLGRGVTITAIIEDNKGRLWFGHSGGISVVDGETTTTYDESDGLLSRQVWCMTFDINDHLWIGTIDGVCKFDGTQFTNFEIPEGKIDSSRGVSSAKIVHHIMEDRQGRIWFSTNGGVYIKDRNKLSHISEKDGLTTPFVNQVLEDKSGVFWISTKKGLFQYTDLTLTKKTEVVVEKFKGTGSIMQDTKGRIWYNANMRDIYSFIGTEFKKYQITEEDEGPGTFQIYEDNQNRLWFVGFGGAYRLEDEQFINITIRGPW